MTAHTLDSLVREQGFDGEDEFHRLVAGAPVDTPARRNRFLHWRNEDGTKAGLVELYLFDAAPDLYAALVALVEPSEEPYGRAYDQARAALAKARGEAVKR